MVKKELNILDKICFYLFIFIWLILFTLIILLFVYVIDLNQLHNLQREIFMPYVIGFFLFNFISFVNVFLVKYLSQKYFVLFFLVEYFFFFFFKDFLNSFLSKNIFIFTNLIFFFSFIFFIWLKKNWKLLELQREKTSETKQTLFYRKFLLSHKILNTINFIYTTVNVVLGSAKFPVKLTNFFLFFVYFFLFFFTYICYNRFLLIFGIFFLGISFRYESFFFNFKSNKAFRRNYLVTSNYWLTECRKSNNIIKRKYCTSIVRMSLEKLGSVTLVNPTSRALFVLGGGFIFCGTLATGAFVYTNNANNENRIIINRENNEHKERMQKMIFDHEKEKMEFEKSKAKSQYWSRFIK